MAAFADQLSDADIAAVVTYQRNAWDNKTGDLAQPAAIAAARVGLPAKLPHPLRNKQNQEESTRCLMLHTPTTITATAHPSGIMRWLTTTNHKDIGTLYLWFALIMLFVAGTMAMLIRAELFQPGLQLTNPDFFNQLTTMHGLIMIFGVDHAGLLGLCELAGAADARCARHGVPAHEQLGFWMLPVAGLLLMVSFLLPGGAVAGGWTMYPPLFIQGGISYDLTILAVHIMGLSSIMGSINIITTILNMRAPGITLMKMPLFCWTWLITAYLLIATMPVLAGAVTMLLTDRNFGTHFFNAAGGGDPVMFQHIFWFFAHPEVYILILPAFGIVSQVIPTFARKPLFGYASMVYATASIAILSFIVWAHHMFTVGMPAAAQLFFMFSTMLIAVPTGVKVFNWVATMWKGSMTFETPMLFAIAFVCLFTIGGFSGLVLAIAPVDIQLHDTYYVVAHFHYVLVSGALFSIFAGIYYWLPKWTGHMYDETLGKWHFWLSVIGMNIVFFPMHFLGLAGMPRRIPDYALQFTEFNQIATVGAFIFGFSQLIFLVVVLKTIKGGAKATDRVWEGAEGLEWTLPSPAPYHTFETAPVVK